MVRHLLPVDLRHAAQERAAGGVIEGRDSGEQVLLSVAFEQFGDGEGIEHWLPQKHPRVDEGAGGQGVGERG